MNMIPVSDALSFGSKKLTEKGITNSLLETRLLIKNILNLSDEDLIFSSEICLSEC